MDNLLTPARGRRCDLHHGACRGADDVMLNYQSTLVPRCALCPAILFGLKRAPEFDDWLVRTGLAGARFSALPATRGLLPDFASRLIALALV